MSADNQSIGKPEEDDGGGGARREFSTVGIGTSAGGVLALQRFFESLPDAIEAAFVVIVHLDPSHQSELPAILAARTPMPVTQVTDQLSSNQSMFMSSHPTAS